MKHYLQISSVISGLFILTKHFTFRVSTYHQQVKGTLIVDKYTLFVCNYIGHYSLIVYRMFFLPLSNIEWAHSFLAVLYNTVKKTTTQFRIQTTPYVCTAFFPWTWGCYCLSYSPAADRARLPLSSAPPQFHVAQPMRRSARGCWIFHKWLVRGKQLFPLRVVFTVNLESLSVVRVLLSSPALLGIVGRG